MLVLFASIVVGVVTAFAAAAEEKLLFGRKGLVKSLVFGGVLFLVNRLTPKIAEGAAWSWLLPIFYCGIIAMDIVVIFDWKREGSDMTEMAPCLVLAGMFFLEARFSAISMGECLVSNEVFIRTLKVIPLIVLILTVAFFFYNMYIFKAEMEDREYYYDEECDDDFWWEEDDDNE